MGWVRNHASPEMIMLMEGQIRFLPQVPKTGLFGGTGTMILGIGGIAGDGNTYQRGVHAGVVKKEGGVLVSCGARTVYMGPRGMSA